MKMLYVAILKTIDPVKDAEILEEHIEYLNKHIANGNIFVKGPFTDKSGGIVVFDVETMEEAKELMDNDPIVIHNTRTYELKQWKSSF